MRAFQAREISAMSKVAIVTGAGTGIGKASALALLKAGWQVTLAGRRAELLDKAVAESKQSEMLSKAAIFQTNEQKDAWKEMEIK